MIIRADGGSGIGIGHLARTSVLAEELKKYTKIKYVCSKNYLEGAAFLRQKGFKVIEAKEPLQVLLNEKDESLLTDHYEVNEDYMQKVRKHFKVTGYIDDNADKIYEADFLLNQNFGAECLDYSKSKVKKFLLGTEYLLLREEFRNIRPIKIQTKVQDILITVGGSDHFNYTGFILEAVKDLPYHFTVVIGIAFPYEKELYQKYKSYSNIRFKVKPNMSEVMQKTDLAITSCGSTLYEIGLFGIPIIGLTVAENQEGLAKRMEERGLIKSLGNIGKVSKNMLCEALQDLAENEKKRISFQLKSRQNLNPQGVVKAAKEIMKLIRAVNGAS